MSYPRVNSFKSVGAFRSYLKQLDLDLELDDTLVAHDGPLARPVETLPFAIGNRFCILPMEGWDGSTQGTPTELTIRRWENFGISGAKLIWGGEAVAVRHDGRANPNQLLINDCNLAELESLRLTLVRNHRECFGQGDDLCVGLQLTHSGRFARPNLGARPEPRIAYRHPILDKRVNIADDSPILTDSDLESLIDDFVTAAALAEKIGFQFVDVKHCHGYLGHELLSGFDRPGPFGGSFENRTRFLKSIVDGIRTRTSNLEVGVRVSIFDFAPFLAGDNGLGIPATRSHYPYAFGGTDFGTGIDLTEPHEFMNLLQKLDIKMVCTTAGSPYYNPHIQRPAAYPPSDGYFPPEDPLVGVTRQITATSELKRQHPNLFFVGSGFSYLQEWLPNVAQSLIARNLVDSIGLGRMVLSYPELPADVIAGVPMKRKKICRTFSDCTTAPRNGLVSGCYPLDPFYKNRPEKEQLVELKRAAAT